MPPSFAKLVNYVFHFIIQNFNAYGDVKGTVIISSIMIVTRMIYVHN